MFDVILFIKRVNELANYFEAENEIRFQCHQNFDAVFLNRYSFMGELKIVPYYLRKYRDKNALEIYKCTL